MLVHLTEEKAWRGLNGCLLEPARMLPKRVKLFSVVHGGRSEKTAMTGGL